MLTDAAVCFRNVYDADQVRHAFHLIRGDATGLVQLAAIHPGVAPLFGFYDDEDAFLLATQEYAGSRNLYVSINLFRQDFLAPKNQSLQQFSKRGGADDISHVRLLPLDMDVDTPRRSQEKSISGAASATDEELRVVLEAGQKILSEPPLCDSGAGCIMSGNGSVPLVPLDIPITDRNRSEIKERLKAAGKYFQHTFKFTGVKIDSTFDFLSLFGVFSIISPYL